MASPSKIKTDSASWHQLTWVKCVQSINDSQIQIFVSMAVRSVCWQSLSSVWVNALTVFPQEFRICVGFLIASWQFYLGNYKGYTPELTASLVSFMGFVSLKPFI